MSGPTRRRCNPGVSLSERLVRNAFLSPLLILASYVPVTDAVGAENSAPTIFERYTINEWTVTCRAGRRDEYNCWMAKQVEGVGLFRIEISRNEIVLVKRDCETGDTMTEERYRRSTRGRPSIATVIHNKIAEAVDQCAASQRSKVDDTSDVVSLLELATK